MIMEHLLNIVQYLSVPFQLVIAFFALRVTMRFLEPKGGVIRMILLYAIHFITSTAIIYAGVGDYLPPLVIAVIFITGICLLCKGTMLPNISLGIIFALLPFSFNAIVTAIRPPFDQFIYVCMVAFWGVLFLIISRVMPQNARPPIRSKRLWLLINLLALMPIGATFSAIGLTSPIPLNVDPDPFRDSLMVQNENVILIIMGLSVIATLVILVAVVVLSRHEKLEEEQTLWQMRNQYYQHLDESQKQVRRLRHDMANHLTVLASLEGDAMHQYLEQLSCLPAMQSGHRYCENSVVNVVLSAKSTIMEDEHISVELNIAVPEIMPLSDIDLCALFANSLDNAIEANLKLPQPQRRIALKAAIDKGFFALKLNNAMDGTLNIKEGKIVTTKADREFHGFGLTGLQDIAKQYGGSLHIENDKNEFRLLVAIPMQI